MMKKSLLLLVIFSVLFFLLGQNTFASIAASITVVNHITKECSVINLGDECVGCSLINNWENIPSSYGKYEECPVDYIVVNLEYGEDYICQARKDTFCCTIDHSGMAGDCEDVVVNNTKKQCAFVEDINNCKKLPAGWELAKEISFWGKVCPSLEYEWINDIKCLKEDEKMVITVIIGIGGILVAVLWFLIKKRKIR